MRKKKRDQKGGGGHNRVEIQSDITLTSHTWQKVLNLKCLIQGHGFEKCSDLNFGLYFPNC